MHKSILRAVMSAIFVLGLLATAASAQMSPWGAPGGYPAFVGTAPPPPPMRGQPGGAAPWLPNPNSGCAPNPCMSPYGCPPPMCKPPILIEPAVYVGYLFKDRGVGINIQFNDGDVVGITSTRNDLDLQGVWLELALPVALSQNANIFFTGAHLFPVQTKAFQSYGLLTGVAKREWHTDIQWWEINAGIGYRFAPFVSGVGGFRWSSFVVNFNDPTSQLGFTVSTDDAKLTANAYIPFFGLEMNYEPDCNSSIKGAVIGFPALPSDVEYRENLSLPNQVSTRFDGQTSYKSGYFLEFLGEASVKMQAWSLGALARFDILHAERTRDFTTVAGAGRQAEISFDRRNWILGGKVGVMF
jgi:hypothetical protein